MPVKNHIHKYLKKKVKVNHVYACALPDCSHFVQPALVVGRKSICWICNEEMIVYRDTNGVAAKPHHKECTRKKDKSHVKVITDVNPLDLIEELAKE